MARLTQRRFAALLREGMEGAGVAGKELARRTGIHETTISRYRDDAYSSGPPTEERRRRLERALSLPRGYLEGEVEVEDWVQVRRANVTPAVRDQPPVVREPTSPYLAGGGEDFRRVYGLAAVTMANYAQRGELVPADVALQWLNRLFEAAIQQVDALTATPSGGAGDRAAG